MPQEPLHGSVLVLILYDVCEEIRLDQLPAVLGSHREGPSLKLKHAAPEYVRFQRPPVIEPLDVFQADKLGCLGGQIKYYDYGVLSVLFERSFSGDWPELIRLSSEWMASTDFERHASRIAHQKLERAGAALVKPYPDWLVEDYFIFQITDVAGHPPGAKLLEECGEQVAQVVRGELMRLSDAERKEVLQSSLSYYPDDLTVIGWHAAFVYDSPAGAQTSVQLLEYANSQLLEFRYYDELLTRELARVYATLETGSGWIRRWRLAREATRLQTVALEVTELAERADNAIKFLSDMFSARLYEMAAARVGALDYKRLVDQKLRTANDLYRFMMEQFQQGRAFVLELMVVVILVIELVFFFRGKP